MSTDDMDQRVAAERQRLADEYATAAPLRSFLWPALVALMGVGIGVSFTLVVQDVTGAGAEVVVAPEQCTVEAASPGVGVRR